MADGTAQVGLMDWASADRATVTLRDLDDVHARLPAVVELVGRWMRATADGPARPGSQQDPAKP